MPPKPETGKRRRLQDASEMVPLKLLHEQLNHPLPQSPPPPPPLETQPSPPEIAALTSKASSATISPLPSIQNQPPPPSPPPLYAIHSRTTSADSVTSSSATVRNIQFKELQLNSVSQPEIDELEARISSLETAGKKTKSILTREAIRELRGQIQTKRRTDDEGELLPASSQVGPSMYEVGLNGPSGSALFMISTPGSWHSMLSDQGHKKGKTVVDDDDEVSSNV